MTKRRGYEFKKGGKGVLPFIMIEKWLLRSPAWRDLDCVSRSLYWEIKDRLNGVNNGQIGLGCREAAEALNVGVDTAARAFKNLEQHGFIVITSSSTFNQKRLTREWRLTELRDDRNGALATKDFMRWSPAPPVTVPAVPTTPRKLVSIRGGHAAA